MFTQWVTGIRTRSIYYLYCFHLTFRRWNCKNNCNVYSSTEIKMKQVRTCRTEKQFLHSPKSDLCEWLENSPASHNGIQKRNSGFQVKFFLSDFEQTVLTNFSKLSNIKFLENPSCRRMGQTNFNRPSAGIQTCLTCQIHRKQ